MDNLEFPFVYEVVPGFGRMFLPIIRVGINTVDGFVKYNFIVDTGADFTTLPNFMAQKLGIDLKYAKQSEAVGLGGHIVKTWMIKIKLVFDANKSIVVRASITDENSTPFLLGRVDCLDVIYGWNFDAKQKRLIFEKM